MTKIILCCIAALCLSEAPAQNLVTNPDAESLPRGTGWTVVSSGALTCLLAPTNNYQDWTMIPNGTVNYPYDHTTGAAGGTVFFSGCDDFLAGPFEAFQTIDVSADAALIDAGTQLYEFNGYIQTPVEPQTDRGRFVVDFMDASNTVLDTYFGAWQSNFEGSGINWVHHNDTRLAPAGTRQVKIRLQTRLFVHRPAINVYFDDISLTRSIVTPLGLQSFTGKELEGRIYLYWDMANLFDCKQFDLERSVDGTHFSRIARFTGGKINYQFIDDGGDGADQYLYRLKMTGNGGKTDYSKIVRIKTGASMQMHVSPNPAKNSLRISGLAKQGMVSIVDHTGRMLMLHKVNSGTTLVDISKLPAGVYIVRYNYNENNTSRKLVVER